MSAIIKTIVYVKMDESIKNKIDTLKGAIDKFKESFPVGDEDAIYLPCFNGDTRIETLYYNFE